MINLYEETTKKLLQYGKTWDDVEWVGTSTLSLAKQSWKSQLNIDYDNGYGSQNIHPDLVVVGKNFWLEREEYDGAEGWSFKVKKKKPSAEVLLLDVKHPCYDYNDSWDNE